MGKVNQGVLGGFSGKVGPVVGYRHHAKYYVRSRAAQVSNPRTPEQQRQRGRFATAFNFLKDIKPFIRIGYKGFTQERSAFNAAMSYMLKRVVKGNEGNAAIDYDRVLVSSGTLMPVFKGEARAAQGEVTVEWEVNSGMGNAEGDDVAMLLIYNADRETSVYDTEAALRADGSAVLPVPEDWHQDTLVVYLGFCSADGSLVANSVRLATGQPM